MSHTQTHTLALNDGRTLAWSAYGPTDGRPVLFLAGAATGKSMTFGEEALADHDICLITVDRPGMGGSTDDRDRTLRSTARDLAVLIGDEFGGRLPVVGNSQGAPFGLALAELGAASHLVLVSPADEVAVEPVTGLLPQALRTVVQQVNGDPVAARAFLQQLGADGMEAMVLAGADDGDRAVYADPAFLLRYRAALAEGFANRGQGYVTDTMLAMSPWRLDLNALRCPVELWFGARDLGHSPDQGRSLAARIPGARRYVIPDAGGSLLWTHSEQILASIPR